MSRHVALCHVISRHVMSRHVTSCHVMSRHVTSCHVMSRHVTSCHVMYLMSRHGTSSRHVISRNVTSCHITSCHVMSHLAPSCHVMSYHVTSYHVESRGTVTRPTLHCQLTSSTRNQFKLSMTMFVGCPEGCRYHTASAVYDLVMYELHNEHGVMQPLGARARCLNLEFPKPHGISVNFFFIPILLSLSSLLD